MDHTSQLIQSEVPDVQQIVDDECWLEGERRGCAISGHDPAIQTRVADIILNGTGEYLRRKHLDEGGSPPVVGAWPHAPDSRREPNRPRRVGTPYTGPRRVGTRALHRKRDRE